LKVYVGNDGCVEGQLSSTSVERFFENNKQVLTKDPTEADLVVLWVCGLTEQREKQVLETIQNVKRAMKPDAKFVVWGCLPKINPEALRRVYDGPIVGALDTDFFRGLVENKTAVCDTMDISGSIDSLVPSMRTGIQRGDAVTDTMLSAESTWKRGWERARKEIPFVIRVAKGCTGNCSYCSELPVFGRIKSRSLESIASDFAVGLKHGYRSFSLMATDLGAYGKDISCTLPDLLKELIKTNTEKEYKIVLNQVNPFHLKSLYPALEEIFETGKIDALNSPVQSGSDRILGLMRRPHTAEEWRQCMTLISNRFPRIRLRTQFMVGFPTETEEDFKATERMLDLPAMFDDVFIFKFSPRPRVHASRIVGQVQETTKENRRRRLLRKCALMKGVAIATKAVRGAF
jgi:MiaB/RimO family radical SAM methylthiotransferase